ncbi:hypothetical protein TNIN_33221 [Trichonephila inaurata madagascariensis]|uniref:Uncharacterized protein n=1 Tax=Trichonephila inaurata madagascariensis TaxID=2747483 RepID=A0A8X6YU47_9ARAC|nr:hypothetical protein TNIN_33221 [Trichonephila inaurata madagascariensis]
MMVAVSRAEDDAIVCFCSLGDLGSNGLSLLELDDYFSEELSYVDDHGFILRPEYGNGISKYISPSSEGTHRNFARLTNFLRSRA